MNSDAAAPREWNAQSYHALSEPQFEWGKHVLASLALDGNEVVLDAGCGTGRLTALLDDRLPRGHTVALDRSENMVRVAKEMLAPRAARCDVVLGDLSALPFRAAFDVVFSTATFHWVPDHDVLFANLFAVLRQGGRVHAQCGGGANLERIHERADLLRRTPAFAGYFANWREPWEFATAELTAQRLARAGFRDVRTSVQAAPTTFRDAAAYQSFVSTVVLRPFLSRLPTEELRTTFAARITEAAAHNDPPFTLDYWRLNIQATK